MILQKTHFKITIFVIAMIVSLSVPTATFAQKRCSRCQGKGMIRTRIASSRFGLGNITYEICSRCGQKIDKSDEHWDPCPKCHGSGTVSSGRNDNDSYDENDSFYYESYLTQDERNAVYQIKQQMSQLQHVYYQCTVCNGTGRCSICGGTGGYYTQGSYEGHCIYCGGSGMCITCKGTGTSYHFIQAPDNQQLLEQLAYYIRLASQRANSSKKW